MKRFTLFWITGFLFTLSIALPQISMAQEDGPTTTVAGIIATVNEDIITAADLNSRINLVITSSGLPNKDEVKRSLVPQVIRTLVDEKLKIKEAIKNNISVTPQEVEAQIAQIAARNNMTMGQFMETLSEGNTPVSALKEQIKADLLWRAFVQKRLKSRAEITSQEVNAAAKKIEQSSGQSLMRIAEIFIDVPSPKEEEAAKKFANDLLKQIKAGAPFPALAKQFSASASAATNGDLGWIQEGSLSEEILNDAVSALNKNQVSPVVRGQAGYYIFFMIDKRTSGGMADNRVFLNLKRIHDKNQETLSNADMIQGCLSMEQNYKRFNHDLTGDINRVSVEKLSPKIKQLLSSLRIAEKSPIIAEKDGYSIYMVCRRIYQKQIDRPTKDSIRTQLQNERLDLLQRQHLRALRNSAFIDIRLF